MRIKKGDRVRSIGGGPEMEVLAVGASIAICEWTAEGVRKTDLFNVTELMAAGVSQQAQQPQPTDPPSD